MKKILLALSLFGTIYSFGQNSAPCTSCLHGAPNPNYSGPPHHNTPNGNSTLGLSYLVQNLCGLNYTSGSVLTETRSQPFGFNATGTGFPTTVAIAGLPPGFVVQKAYVYYGCSYTEATPPATNVSITNPSLVNSVIASTMIGTGGDVCWGTTGTCGYRCDVTPAISGNGNYSINLTGFANAAYEVDGVTLIIVYVDPAATYSGNIGLWDGNIWNSTGNTLSYTGTGFTACTNSSAATAFGAFGDCQSNACSGTNTDDFNGSSATFTNDFWNFNTISTSVTACQNSCVFDGYTNNSGCDCWLWNLSGLYWQYATCTSCAAMTVTDVATNPSCGNNNGSIILNVVGGTAPYTYTWTPNVSTTASATGLSAGTYQVTVHDAGCNVQTLSVTLTMVTLNVSDVQTNILCAGQTNGSASFTVGGGVAPYTYSWAPNVNTTAMATGLSAGSYTITIKDNNGCQYTSQVVITQPPALTVTIVPTGATCNGTSTGQAAATGHGGTGAYTYQWSPIANTNATATGLRAGTYTVTVTDNNGCIATASTTITQPTPLTASVTGPAIVCNGSTGTLTATGGGGTVPYSYSWSSGLTSTTSTATISPVANTTYTVTITDNNGCWTTAQITVDLGPPLFVAISGGPISICAGLSSSLCAITNGGTGGNTYLWQPGGATTPCITVLPSTTTTYTVSVTDNCGTTTTASQIINVNPAPSVNFTPSVTSNCAPLCVQFFNTTSLPQGGPAQYVWTFGNGDSSHLKQPLYCYPDGGEFNVSLTVTSDSGCSATLTKVNLIDVYARPQGAFSVSPQPATILDPTIDFTDKTTDKFDLIYWTWTFGDATDSVSYLENPVHTYQDTGTYCASMIVTDAHGCKDTVTNCLIISPIYTLYIPSAFSPNGDGRDETFEPKGTFIKNFDMYIFDRWGMVLCHTTDINTGWNGTVAGGSKLAQEDVYVYKIQVTDAQGTQHNYVGNVTLVK